jgi:hypothetical protein
MLSKYLFISSKLFISVHFVFSTDSFSTDIVYSFNLGLRNSLDFELAHVSLSYGHVLSALNFLSLYEILNRVWVGHRLAGPVRRESMRIKGEAIVFYDVCICYIGFALATSRCHRLLIDPIVSAPAVLLNVRRRWSCGPSACGRSSSLHGSMRASTPACPATGAISSRSGLVLHPSRPRRLKQGSSRPWPCEQSVQGRNSYW